MSFWRGTNSFERALERVNELIDLYKKGHLNNQSLACNYDYTVKYIEHALDLTDGQIQSLLLPLKLFEEKALVFLQKEIEKEIEKDYPIYSGIGIRLSPELQEKLQPHLKKVNSLVLQEINKLLTKNGV